LVRGSIIFAASIGALLLSACSSGGDLPQALPDTGPPPAIDPKLIRLPFLVDDYFVPNGCFGDNDCRGEVMRLDSRACADKDPPATLQGVCRLYDYLPLPQGAPGFLGYVGILFQDVGPGGISDIGLVPGRPVEPGAARVVFWARVGAGLVDVEFRAGGANNWKGKTDPNLPYKDGFGVSDTVTLTSRFQEFSIDLSGVSYDDVVSPFGWSITSNGSTDAVELYIADARWE